MNLVAGGHSECALSGFWIHSAWIERVRMRDAGSSI